MIAVAIGLVLAPGLGAAISPMAIVAVLILLTSTGGRTRALMFSLGVFTATLALAAIVLVVSLSAQVHTSGTSSKIASGVSLTLGFLLIWFAFKQWQKRPKPGKPVVSPKWMTSLDTATADKSFTLGIALSLMNAKNIPIAIATVTAVTQLSAGPWVNASAIVVFAVLGSLGVVIPLIAAVVGGATVAGDLKEAKGYLVEHNAIILATVFVLLGAQTVGKSMGHLLG